MMEYRTIPYVSKPVSRLLFGTASSPFSGGGDGSALLDAALSLGINTLDTARRYGLSEKSIGDWMEKRQNRDRVVLLSKCAHHDEQGRKRVNEREMREDLTRSLELLRTDFIDIYLLHRDDPDTDVSVAVETLNAMHAEGKIGAFGGSNWTHRRIQEANEYADQHHLIPFTVSSPNFGLAEQVSDLWGGGCVSVSGPAQKDARGWYEKNRMPLIAYSGLAKGFFSGRLHSGEADRAGEVLDAFAVRGYVCPENFRRLARCEELAAQKGCTVSQLALAWLFHQPLNTFAVVSTHSPERMAQNIAALSIPLSREESEYLNLERDTP